MPLQQPPTKTHPPHDQAVSSPHPRPRTTSNAEIRPIRHHRIHPQIEHRAITTGSSTVHTCTCAPAACTPSTNSGVTRRTPPNTSGTCTHPAPATASATPAERRRTAATTRAIPHEPGDHATGLSTPNARTAAIRRRSLNEATTTRSRAAARRTTATNDLTAPGAFKSTLNRIPGHAANTSSSRGIGSRPPGRSRRSTCGPRAFWSPCSRRPSCADSCGRTA